MALSELTATCYGTNCKARFKSPDSVMEALTKPVGTLWFRCWGFSEHKAALYQEALSRSGQKNVQPYIASSFNFFLPG